LNVDDLFALEPTALVAERIHGTAMGSLIAHGDRNAPELPLPRRIHFVSVLGANDQFPRDRLVVDLICQAVVSMRCDNDPTAPSVLIINLSIRASIGLGSPKHSTARGSPSNILGLSRRPLLQKPIMRLGGVSGIGPLGRTGCTI
jgi:hypothetical protein